MGKPVRLEAVRNDKLIFPGVSVGFCGNPDRRPVFRRQEVSAFCLALREHVQAGAFAELEFVRTSGSTRTNQSLPLRGAGDVLNIGAVAVGQAEVFHQVLHAAGWALHV